MAGEKRNIKVHIENVKKTYQGRTGEVVALNGGRVGAADELVAEAYLVEYTVVH